MVTCGICGLEIKKGERPHPHHPDFYLSVWNCKYSLHRTVELEDGSMCEELLPLNLPEDIANWVIYDTCGGAINQSGIYRLPGRVWEWVIVSLKGEKHIADMLLEEIRRTIKKQK